MRYQQLGSGTAAPYPDLNNFSNGNVKEKCMQYARASYHDWSFSYPKGVFANNNGDYEKFRMYAMGKQPISQYKKLLGIDEQTNNTWMSVDWSVRAIVSPNRDKCIARLMENELGIIATPIDMMAKSEMQEFYSQMKAKLVLKQITEQTNPELAQHPLLAIDKADPMDVEELEMRMEYGEQFNRSKDAELAISVGLYDNNYAAYRRGIYEDLFDYGVAGYKEWLGDDNKAKFRKVFPENVVVSFCRQPDFSDMVHAGEVIDVSLVDLALVKDDEGNPVFSDKELTEFAGSIAGKFGNPSALGVGAGDFKAYDKFKCKVFDMEFFAYNEYTYTNRTDDNGNAVFRHEKSGRGSSDNPRYMRKKAKCVYKVKWVIGTDKCYNEGLVDDMKRAVELKKKAQTALSYKFIAYNFYEMRAQGFMERLIPYLDEYQLTIYKIQNFKNRAVPSGWWINLDALENIALNKGGANMQPRELLQMFFETGALLGRSLDANGNPMFVNTQPVIPIQNSIAQELIAFYQDLMQCVQAIEKVCGVNDITNGNPNPKTLVPGYELANMSTNHALYPLKWAEKALTEHLASDILTRMKQGIKKGGINGYGYSLNKNTLQFIAIEPSIALRDYGIIVEEATSQEQKQWLYQMMQQDIANGFLTTSDAVLLVHTFNAKQAMQIWSYRVKKEKERQTQQKMAEIQANNEGNLQAAQVAQQTEMEKMAAQIQAELRVKEMELIANLKEKEMGIMADKEIKMYELQLKYQMNAETNETKMAIAEGQNETKIEATEISSQAEIIKADISGEKSKQKQEIANAKPQPKTSSKK